MSLNLSQVFVRYPDERGAAELLSNRDGEFLVVRTSSPWLAISTTDNAPDVEMAQLLSRGLEATVLWYGLAGQALASRLVRFELGREVERTEMPPDLFRPGGPGLLPLYQDVELVLHRSLRGLGVPTDYIYLHSSEVGMEGEDGMTDAVLVRSGEIRPFRHRAPRREGEEVRTLFDISMEEEQRVCDRVRVRGSYDPKRGGQLLNTLEAVSLRRSLPEGWKIRYLLVCPEDPALWRALQKAHAAGRFTYELELSDE